MGHVFLKTEYDKGSKKEALRLSFSKVEEHVPELAERVVFLRNRVKRLETNFTRDAAGAYWAFVVLTISTVAFGIAVACYGWHYANPVATKEYISTILILLGWVSAVFATGIGSFGLHKRYSAMFASKWATKALQTNIDQLVYDIALDVHSRAEAGKPPPKLSDEELKRFQKAMTGWLAMYTTILSSFGDKYGSALGPVSLPELKADSK
ncbi:MULTISPECIES: hypothetical protein [unclassified Rhizobium]|uniref:hypothetical protein n=1 Tax=unclassified Rhizobium TaxID=2613769 RepID=UPI0006FBBD35|nr:MULTISPECIES: hypothetical protein [unclassified Rhizobium]KQV43635.1 hypothetical protein ASC86_02165 [Rhizobium sp. Root1212]KRD37819.1 hypothetical protein ASE37_02165 [Rhizobium sp. Root268]